MNRTYESHDGGPMEPTNFHATNRDQLFEQIYNGICAWIFKDGTSNGNYWGHMTDVLGIRPNPGIYSSLQFDKMGQIHFNSRPQYSEGEYTIINYRDVNGNQHTERLNLHPDNSAEVPVTTSTDTTALQAAVTAAQSAKTTADNNNSAAQTALTAAQSAASSAATALTSAQAHLTSVEAGVTDPATAATALRNAQSSLAAAQTAQSAASAAESTAAVTNSTAQATLSAAQAQQSTADSTAYAAQTALTSAQSRYQDLRNAAANVTAAQRALTSANVALTNAQSAASAAYVAASAANDWLTNSQNRLSAANVALSTANTSLASAQSAASAASDAVETARENLITDARVYQGSVVLKQINPFYAGTEVPTPELANSLSDDPTAGLLFESFRRSRSLPLADLPTGTTVAWVDPAQVRADAQVPGTHHEQVRVTFPDGSSLTMSLDMPVLAREANPTNTTTPAGAGTTAGKTSQASPAAKESATIPAGLHISNGQVVDAAGHVVAGYHVVNSHIVKNATTGKTTTNTNRQLPQTGSSDHHVGILGLTVAGLLAVIGLGGDARKQRN